MKEYPYDPNHFLEGLYLEGDTVYESVGLTNVSKLIKYNLGSTDPILTVNLSPEIFAEGCSVVGNNIYQLTYRNRKGFIYDKATFQKISEFTIPTELREGWGLTFEGKNLIATDGSNNLFFLDVENPSKIIRTISVAGYLNLYDQLNELEFDDGYLYSNVWFQPVVLKINPSSGEVVGKFDFTEITNVRTTKDRDHVLNGIAFKGDNMLVSDKNWSKIYEIAIEE
ncbi:glutaminyl-peptide cyclotransferase [Elizabethkingia argenteiflava]|uniref:glutaminyl-peptide cyclotransferase n=1 Tax=Elizabethkingia argenteiflava TaxID=2681556 RepID=UPI00293BFD01|nr:glutaminyl-peptide cyclotransferase [Elizabethkingia argenteiflava]